jgi:hypothetical protein
VKIETMIEPRIVVVAFRPARFSTSVARWRFSPLRPRSSPCPLTHTQVVSAQGGAVLSAFDASVIYLS